MRECVAEGALLEHRELWAPELPGPAWSVDGLVELGAVNFLAIAHLAGALLLEIAAELGVLLRGAFVKLLADFLVRGDQGAAGDPHCLEGV